MASSKRNFGLSKGSVQRISEQDIQSASQLCNPLFYMKLYGALWPVLFVLGIILGIVFVSIRS